MGAVANLERKKRYSRWRAGALISVYVLMGIHIAHWLIAGKTLAPLEFNEVLYTIHLGIITAGFIFMALTVVGTLFLGRFFCSWGCHILALQDFSEWLLAKFKIKPKPLKSRAFLFVPFVVMLYLFLWPQLERLISGTAFAGFHTRTDAEGWASYVTTNFWRNLPGIPVTLMTFFFVGFVIVYLLGTRSFCQKVCPYGAIFAIADRFAPGKIKLTGDCTQCGVCTAHCSSHILVHKEIEQFGKVVSPDCLKDLDCVAVCPEDAINYGFTKPSFFKSLARTKTHQTHYHFTLAEDILLAFFTLVYVIIFRGLYGSVPFLLSVTLGVVFSYLTITFIRLFRKEYVRTGPFLLKNGNRLTPKGKFFIPLMGLVFLFSTHCGYVHYHHFTGEAEYKKVIAQNHLLPAAVTANGVAEKLNTSLYHLKIADQWGLYSPLTLNRQLAAIYLYKQDLPLAEKYLGRMLVVRPADTEARLRLAKILYLTNRTDASVNELKKIIEMDSGVKTKTESNTLSEAYLMMGHIEQQLGFAASAFTHYEHSLKNNPQNTEALLALGIFQMQAGHFAEAEKLFVRCNELTPGQPLVHNNLSAIYIRLRNRKKAIEHLKELTRLQPSNAMAQYNLGMLLFSDGNKEEAISSLERAVAIKPDYANARLGLSRVLNDSGRSAEAQSQRQLAEALDPNLKTNRH
ncbi:MAG: tetratricopeptide repeat protein [Bacteroidia bacterium]|nr:tetratricopeptide repeat protein [Bacteroidia bacterium]MCZ2278349.1 tetratricopeptide repeat protein [Bacteroidia bacterium]